MKIGRDFVHKDDLAIILSEVISLIDPDILANIDLYSFEWRSGSSRRIQRVFKLQVSLVLAYTPTLFI